MPAAVEGHCDPRFGPLREAFRANFAERGELGAAVCVMINGHVVADLYGGWADQEQGRRWRPGTLVNVFSVGKGLVAACTARLAGQGKLDLDTAVAAYWPEFAAAGKDSVTVRQLLSHQAGLPAVRRRLPPGAMLDWPAMATALAEQEPWWEPGTAHGVARVYAALISPASPAIVDPAVLEEAVTEQVYGQDLVLHRPSRFGLGFQLTQPERPISPGQATFGHFGAGGSLGFGDPESGVAFGYVMNQMGPRWQNPRTRALVDAVYACL